jgi:hypothetical protein
MIDADGIRTLTSNCTIMVNGIRIAAPIVPGLSMLGLYRELKHLDNGSLYWEGEHILDCMTPVASSSNADLRQWFLVPLPANVFTGNGSSDLHVVLKKTAHTDGGAVFGQYRRDSKKLEMPSAAYYSWEKAFYGVENDRGLTDPRLDERLPLHPEWSARDMSSDPGVQSGAYSIRLLVPLAKSEPVVQLASFPVVFDRSQSDPRWSATLAGLPKPGPRDLWFLQTSADFSNLKETEKINMHFVSKDGTGEVRYRTPWLPHRLMSSQLDYTVPVVPSEIPGSLQSLEWSFVGRSKDASVKPAALISIWRAHANPLADSYEIF